MLSREVVDAIIARHQAYQDSTPVVRGEDLYALIADVEEVVRFAVKPVEVRLEPELDWLFKTAPALRVAMVEASNQINALL